MVWNGFPTFFIFCKMVRNGIPSFYLHEWRGTEFRAFSVSTERTEWISSVFRKSIFSLKMATLCGALEPDWGTDMHINPSSTSKRARLLNWKSYTCSSLAAPNITSMYQTVLDLWPSRILNLANKINFYHAFHFKRSERKRMMLYNCCTYCFW